MSAVPFRTVDVDGLKVFYREAGPNDGSLMAAGVLGALVAITQMVGKGMMSSRREPCRVFVDLIDDMVRGLGICLFGIVGYDQKPEAAGESNPIGRAILFLQLGDIAVVHLAIRPRAA